MFSKKTQDLLEELKSKNIDINTYLENNTDSLIEINLKNFWDGVVKNSGMSKSDIINKSDFGYVYFYDVINGRKIPSTDKIVRLALATKMTLEQCQTALKYSGKSPLYPRIKRDSVLIFAITHNYDIYQTAELLLKEGLAELK